MVLAALRDGNRANLEVNLETVDLEPAGDDQSGGRRAGAETLFMG
jgi:hypothetical protein